MKNLNHFLFIFLIGFVLISAFSLPAAALSIPTGFKSVGNGNGFFDNENSFFNVSVDTNVFVIVKADGIWILEPLGFAIGISDMGKIINGSGILSAVVGSDGYLYFSDANGLYKDKIRSASNVWNFPDDIYDPDINPTGHIIRLVGSANIPSIKLYGGYIYYYDQTNNNILRFQSPTYIPEIVETPTGGKLLGFAIDGGDIYTIIYYDSGNTAYSVYLYKNNINIYTFLSDNLNTGGVPAPTGDYNVYIDGLLDTNVYVVLMTYTPGGRSQANIVGYWDGSTFNNSNIVSAFQDNFQTTMNYGFVGTKDNHFYHFISDPNLSEVSAFSSKSAIIYAIPAQITYDQAVVFSVYDTYANNSKLEIGYNIDYSMSSGDWDLIKNNYIWKIEITNPDNFKVAESTILAADCSGIFTITCTKGGGLLFDAPISGWVNGTYQAHLYEINVTTNNKAELDNYAFQILNKSSQPAGAGKIDYSTSTAAERVDSFLKNDYFWAIMIILISLCAGVEVGGMGILIGGGIGIISTYMLGLVPAWVLFTFVIMILLALAMKGGDRFSGGGS